MERYQTVSATSLIKHDAIVVSLANPTARVSEREVRVVISDGAGCGGCKLSALCGSRGDTGRGGASQPKNGGVTLTATVPPGLELHAGDRITIGLSEGNRYRAMLWLLVMPLMLAATAMTVCVMSHTGDGTAGVAALATLTLTYMVMWLCRKRIDSRARWYVTALTNPAAGAENEKENHQSTINR